MRKMVGLFLALVGVGAALVLGVGTSVSKQNVAKAFNPTSLPEIQERLLSGFATLELNQPEQGVGGSPSTFNPRGNDQCPSNIASNIKVNQNCLNLSDPALAGRGQAQNETSLAVNKQSTNQIVASQNDYRRGDGNCYADYSTDGGRTWEDSTVPMSFSTGGGSQFPNGAREYWQAGGDTSVAWDTKGNAYLSCQVFNRGLGATNSPDLSSAFLVFRSSNHGASWNFPGRYVQVTGDVTGSGDSFPFLDKQLMTVDDHVGSPFQDRIYVSWTEFAADGSAFIYEAYSSDYGEHFSPPHLVSVNSPLCVNTYGAGTTALTGESSNCNENQFSQPFTGSDGALYIVYNNYNNAETLHGTDNRNQFLLSKSTDGGNTFSAPVKVGDYYDLPDCATYQSGKDFGRACVPEKNATSNSIFRATNYASGEVDPTNANHVVVTYGSYINRHSNESNGCVPAGINPVTGQDLYTGVKTAGACNNDILVSQSTDGGATFTGTATDPRQMPVATTDPGQATTDQFWQWFSFTKNGKLATSYYDRQFGTDEATGYSDVSLSSSSDGASWNVNRVTSSSMPPPTQFSGTFFGDYTGLDAWENANPIWMDTRNPELFTGGVCGGSVYATCTGTYSDTGLVANDQDIYTANVSVTGK
jgi:hypothetical protein